MVVLPKLSHEIKEIRSLTSGSLIVTMELQRRQKSKNSNTAMPASCD
jgi:hypothetical protein